MLLALTAMLVETGAGLVIKPATNTVAAAWRAVSATILSVSLAQVVVDVTQSAARLDRAVSGRGRS
jgi:hypothetical protein